MKQIFIPAALCVAVQGAAFGATTPSTQSRQMQELRSEVGALRAEVAALRRALPAAQLRAMRRKVTRMSLTVGQLEQAATQGPVAGLSVTGYLDPTYVYNRDQHSAGFQFVNHDPGVYNYYNSSFGDVYLDIKKTFGVGDTAPSAEIVIEPNRGAGSSTQSESGALGNNIFNQAQINVPINLYTTAFGGLLQSLAGYEPQPSNMMLTLTHNLLFDFSEPAGMIGIGLKGSNSTYTHFWQVIVGNEQLRTAASTVTASGATVQANRVPTVSARFDDAVSSALDIGVSGALGRSTLFSPGCTTGFGYQCANPSAYGTYRYVETDLTYTADKTQYNAQADFGELGGGAWNGGTARWYGVSVLGHREWNTAAVGHMGATLRADYLNDTANGGGGAGIIYGAGSSDPLNGFGVDPTCMAASGNGGLGCRGTARYALTGDLLFYPTRQVTVKMEYRHDGATNPVFATGPGTSSRSNDLLAAELLYSF